MVCASQRVAILHFQDPELRTGCALEMMTRTIAARAISLLVLLAHSRGNDDEATDFDMLIKSKAGSDFVLALLARGNDPHLRWQRRSRCVDAPHP